LVWEFSQERCGETKSKLEDKDQIAFNV